MGTGRLMIAAVAALGLAGCASFEPPDVRLDDVRLGGLGLGGGTLYVEFWVYNPNRFAIETESLTYDLLLGGPGADEDEFTRVAQGTFEEPVRVAARDSTRVEVPVDFRYSGLGGALRGVIDRGAFEYRVSGQVRLEEPARRTVPYRERGRVDVGR